MKYRIHHFKTRMTEDQIKLENFLNCLEREVISIISYVSDFPGIAHVDFLLIVEKVT
jgi:hypothetical protein